MTGPLGHASRLEQMVYAVLTRHRIAFTIQLSFEGGSALLGEPRVIFLLRYRPVVIEPLGPWHALPGAAVRDERQWTAWRQLGLRVVTIEASEAATPEVCDRILLQRIGRRLR